MTNFVIITQNLGIKDYLQNTHTGAVTTINNQTHMKLKSTEEVAATVLIEDFDGRLAKTIGQDRHHLIQTIRKELEGEKEWSDEMTNEEKTLVREVLGEKYTTPEYIEHRMYGWNAYRKHILTLLTTLEEEVVE